MIQDTNIIIKEITGKIDFQENFTNNKSVKYCLGDNFKMYVLNSARNIDHLPEMKFSKHQLPTISDKEIMENFFISKLSGLMTREEILCTIIDLTNKQPKGENGVLNNYGKETIIGYMLCVDSIVRVVNIHWNTDDNEWFCRCNNLGCWLTSCEMLSRNK